MQTIQSALISVSDKQGLEPLARALQKAEVKIYSTGGTLKFLKDHGIEALSVESVTEFPEMMHGRLKTLHPKVFGGILARRDHAEDLDACKTHGLPLIDLVIVNLYPFENYLGKELSLQIENIDIGGPSLLRAAAKNHNFTSVLSSPQDYAEFLEHWTSNQHKTHLDFRRLLAQRTFARTARYDQMIAQEWTTPRAQTGFPKDLSLEPAQPLRYGENPHQKAVYVGTPSWKQIQGKELSYNNLLDTEAAVQLTEDFAGDACAIIKHGNPCGVASDEKSNALDLFRRALSGDPVSAFGGVISFNTTVDEDAAQALSELFLEVIVAPAFTSDAVTILSKKTNLRLIEWTVPHATPFEVRAAMGGWLLQEKDTARLEGEFKVATKIQPTKEQWKDLNFAWTACKHVRSNAIVVAHHQQALGIGAGQMSRIDSVRIAIEKATSHGLNGAVLASDAFFPFRDNIDKIAPTGIKAIIAPGGSKKDAEVIEACNEHGLALVIAPRRHFKH